MLASVTTLIASQECVSLRFLCSNTFNCELCLLQSVFRVAPVLYHRFGTSQNKEI
jgi:hypothetical protein